MIFEAELATVIIAYRVLEEKHNARKEQHEEKEEERERNDSHEEFEYTAVVGVVTHGFDGVHFAFFIEGLYLAGERPPLPVCSLVHLAPHTCMSTREESG